MLGFSGDEGPFPALRLKSKAETQAARIREVLFAEIQKERLHRGRAVGPGNW
jgi:hypothetical protein